MPGTGEGRLETGCLLGPGSWVMKMFRNQRVMMVAQHRECIRRH